MTKEEKCPAGCVLRLFGAPEQTVQKAVAALPDTWQGTVHCRSRGAETLVALQSSTPQQLHRAVQQLRTSLAPALYGEGEQTLAAAAVQALEQHRKLLVCSDTAAGALLETRLENLPGAEKVFDFGAMSYANTALTARLSRKQARDTAISMLEEAKGEENASEEVANEASETLQVLAGYTVAETQIENLVVAKGYADCVAFMGADSISVVVSAPDGLEAEDVAKIKDIVIAETSYTPGQIKIMEAGTSGAK